MAIPTSLRSSLSDATSRTAVKGDGDSWNIGDWRRFVKAWKKEDEKERSQRQQKGRSLTSSAAREERDNRKKNKEEDAAFKSSIENLTAVFEWIVDSMPNSSESKSSEKKDSERETATRKARESKDPRLKFDLEKFYVSLSRKLYDDGF